MIPKADPRCLCPQSKNLRVLCRDRKPEPRRVQSHSSEPVIGGRPQGQGEMHHQGPPPVLYDPGLPQVLGHGGGGCGGGREGSIICAGFSMGNYSRDCSVSMLAGGHCLGATVKISLTVKGKRQACEWEERMGVGGESRHPRALMVVST